MDVASIVAAVVGIAGSPIIWTIIARNEYRNKTMTKMFGGKYQGCYVLAAWIFLSSLGKDYLFSLAVDANSQYTLSSDPNTISALWYIGSTLAITGGFLVVAAFYRLGITGTYLGDYFGIYMNARVTAFPFNVFENPMYLGSTTSFLGIALQRNSLIGLPLTFWVWLVYEVATRFFENPFTTKIYAERAKQLAASTATGKRRD